MGCVNGPKSFLDYRIRKVIYELSPTVRNRPDGLRAEYIISVALLKMHALSYFINSIYFV